MKAILEFDLDNCDDKTEHNLCINANKLQLIIWDLDQWLRDNYKYDKGEIGVKESDIVRTKLREIMNEYSLTFEHEIFK